MGRTHNDGASSLRRAKPVGSYRVVGRRARRETVTDVVWRGDQVLRGGTGRKEGVTPRPGNTSSKRQTGRFPMRLAIWLAPGGSESYRTWWRSSAMTPPTRCVNTRTPGYNTPPGRRSKWLERTLDERRRKIIEFITQSYETGALEMLHTEVAERLGRS